MHFYFPRENKQLNKLTQSPLFSSLAEFLDSKAKDTVIHRELVKVFPERKLEITLEQAISMGLIQRKNRRYSLSFPIFEEEQGMETGSLLDDLSAVADSKQLQLMDTLWREWFAGKDYFFASRKALQFYEQRKIGNASLCFINYAPADSYGLNFPDYFSLLDSGQPMPQELEGVETMLGDVSRGYFMDQMTYIFEEIREGRGGTIRPGIFVSALKQMQAVSEDLTKILLSRLSDETFPLPDSFQKLAFSEDESVAVYEKSCCFSTLMQKMNSSSLSFYRESL